jgi:hypothetical protein
MNVTELIDLLRAMPPKANVYTDPSCHDLDRSHGKIRVFYFPEGGVVINRFTAYEPKNRHFCRTAITNGPQGIQSYIQEFKHLRAKTELESREDLECMAITAAEHMEDITKIRALEEDRVAREESQARAQFELLSKRFASQNKDTS